MTGDAEKRDDTNAVHMPYLSFAHPVLTIRVCSDLFLPLAAKSNLSFDTSISITPGEGGGDSSGHEADTQNCFAEVS
jgi:hypothetical protein